MSGSRRTATGRIPELACGRQNSLAASDVLGSHPLMSIRVHIAGKVCLPEEAKISVFDRGFLYGDSVYETIGTAYGRLFAAADHLDRLERSAMRIGLRVPPRADIERAIAETIEAAGNPESRMRV